MSTFDPARAARHAPTRFVVVFASLFAGLAFLRCAPPEQCLRMSDCATGYTCVEGSCRGPEDDAGDAGSSDATASDASRADGRAPRDASTDDAAARDARDAGEDGGAADAGAPPDDEDDGDF